MVREGRRDCHRARGVVVQEYPLPPGLFGQWPKVQILVGDLLRTLTIQP
jgi:hypothetical protein